MDLVVADIGGTHARFAIAAVKGGEVRLSREWTGRVSEHATFSAAYRGYAARQVQPLPPRLAVGIAGHVDWPASLDPIAFTNNEWVIDPRTLGPELGLEGLRLLNDFVAIGHAVARAPDEHFVPLSGPPGALDDDVPITVIGPGTGTGIAMARRGDAPMVQGTEGAHFDFAPVDPFDDRLLARLRRKHGRVSAERVVSGPGLADIAAIIGGEESGLDLVDLWQCGIEGRDAIAAQAVERFCMSLGSVAGDVALAQGAKAVVLTGGLGERLFDILPRSGFSDRFCAKGRYRAVMERMKVRRLKLDQPGLIGAALAFSAD